MPLIEANRHFASSCPPCKALGESVDLIIVASRKSQQFRGELFKPSGAPGKTNRAPCEQIALRDHASALVGIGLVDRDIDRFLAQALDQPAADRGVLDEKSRGHIVPLDLHHLALERVKWKPTPDHLKNVEHLLAPQQNDASGIVPSFALTQCDVPAYDDAVTALVLNIIIGRQPFAFDNSAARRHRALLILG